MTYRQVRIWVNNSYGPRGIMLWLMLAAWFVVLYVIYYWLTNASLLNTNKPVDLFLIDFLVLFVEVFIAVFFVSFFFQCIHTVESIRFGDDFNIYANLFYGKKKKFHASDVQRIIPFVAKGVSSIYSPFESKKNNYRVDFKDGGYICLSGAMKNIEKFVGDLRVDPEIKP